MNSVVNVDGVPEPVLSIRHSASAGRMQGHCRPYHNGQAADNTAGKKEGFYSFQHSPKQMALELTLLLLFTSEIVSILNWLCNNGLRQR